MSSNNSVKLPFDPEGNKATNLITGEIQVLDPPDYLDFYFIIPQSAPFFADTLEMVRLEDARPLVRGRDWVPSYRFNDASYQCGKDIYGAITIYNRALAGAVRMKYQSLGGNWTIDEAKITELLNNAIVDPRITTWEQVAGLPDRFPPINHDWNIVDMVGQKEKVEALYAILEAIKEQAGAALPAHLADFNNPHRVTKGQVELGNVQNYPVANLAEAQAGTATNRYMTPERVRQAVLQMFTTTLDVHVARQDNPHGTNAAQVGLGSVQNFALATTAEAQAGTTNAKYMTPQLVKAAIDSQVMAVLTPHVSSLANPHQTNKDQVGLPLVENYGIATLTEARAGTATNKYMTPALVREAINAQLLTGLDQHINNRDNPHGVTQAQVGLPLVQNFGVATEAEAKLGSATNKYMTPALVRAAIESLGGAEFNSHINATDNPHQVDKIQVGLSNVMNYGIATEAEAIAGASNVKYMTPAMVKAAMGAMSGLDDLQTQVTTHVTARNPHGTTASDVGAYTKAESDAAALLKLGKTEKAADSSKVDGLTLAQLDTRMSSTKLFPAVAAGTAETWTELCSWSMSDPVATSRAPDLSVEVSGGGRLVGSGDRQQFRVTLNLNTPDALRVEQLAGQPAQATFGVAVVGGRLGLYMRGPADRTAISMRYISDPGMTLGTAVVTTIPTGLRYSDAVRFQGTRPQDDGTPGDLDFGVNTFNNPSVGHIVEYINLVDVSQDEAATSVNNLPAVLADDVLTFRPRAVFDGAIPYGSTVFGHDPVADVITATPAFDANGLTYTVLDGLTAPYRSGDYVVEVELGSTNSNYGNALGVTIAEIAINGKSYALQVLRSPGQLVVDAKNGELPGGSGYGLLTIGVNLLQADAQIIEAFSGNGLTWGDGVIAANRDLTAQPYNQATSGWSAGKIRLRITRTATTIKVETTNPGQTAYLTGAAVVTKDLTTTAGLEKFANVTSSWGVLDFCQPQSTFKLLNRPDKLQPYAVISKTAQGVDQSKLYRHNGTAWVASDLVRGNPLARPGRMVYSDWNGRIGHWRRDGTIRMLYIESFTRATTVALAE